MLLEVDREGYGREGFSFYEIGPGVTQKTFILVTVFLIKKHANDSVKDGVAEVLQLLVIGLSLVPWLIQIGTMGNCFVQKGPVLETILDCLF